LYFLELLCQVEPTAINYSLIDLLWRASLLAKLVLLSLVGFSIFSWGIILSKSLRFSRSEQQTRRFLEIFHRSSKLAEVYAACTPLKASPLVSLFLAGYQELDKQLKAPSHPAQHSLISINRALQRAAITETTHLEEGITWLASTASAAPFIGLFGTVVGIIIAFQGLSSTTQASVQAVAPGIAEALIATAAGIAAAVPAALAYNYFLNKIKLLTAQMDSFTLEFLNLVEHTFPD
jgi:biopolymer transport protein TolQ